MIDKEEKMETAPASNTVPLGGNNAHAIFDRLCLAEVAARIDYTPASEGAFDSAKERWEVRATGTIDASDLRGMLDCAERFNCECVTDTIMGGVIFR